MDNPAAEGSQPLERRRGFLGWLASLLMASGLAAGYGTFCSYAAWFLFPTNRNPISWQFVAQVANLRLGESLPFTAPTGAKVVVARQGDGDEVENFVALSSVCPHLGCAVHWEAQNERFFCPCHNGAFDAAGKATEGPPAAANQELERFPLKIEGGLLYIGVPSTGLTRESRG